ncbi:hypothetical protein [Micromonospora sp. NPDC048898]|uniref:allene oxide cyclase barrel-like domain-containing protein n=1 Tax=Micromonospora sp. NPDC048898 TaxID=3364260 RepID=UPI003717F8D5
MPSKSLTARLAAVVVSLVVAVVAVPGAASAAPAQRGCITVSFIEQLISTDYRDAAPTGPSVGDVVLTLDAVLNADRVKIGENDIKGTIIRQDSATGELFSFSTSKYTIPDGGIRVAGIVNLTSLAAGETQKLTAFGTAGRYKGKVGQLTWTLVNELESENSITLC